MKNPIKNSRGMQLTFSTIIVIIMLLATIVVLVVIFSGGMKRGEETTGFLSDETQKSAGGLGNSLSPERIFCSKKRFICGTNIYYADKGDADTNKAEVETIKGKGYATGYNIDSFADPWTACTTANTNPSLCTCNCTR